MPLGSWWPLLFTNEAERIGAFSDALLDYVQGNNAPELIKLLRINFPTAKDTIILAPNSTTLSSANTSAQGAATKHEAIDDPPESPNDDTDYIRINVANTATEDRVGFEDLPNDVVEVEEVRLYCRASSGFEAGVIEDDGPWTFALRTGGTNFFRDNAAPDRYFNIAYHTNALRFPVNPDTGEQWTKAEVDALEASLQMQPDGYGSAFGQRITQAWLAVDVKREEIGLFASDAPNVKGEGTYLNRVMQWGTVVYSASGASGQLERPSMKVRIADHDNKLTDIFYGELGEDARFAPVDIRYASSEVPKLDADGNENWYTSFKGVLVTWDKIENAREWELTFRVDDSALESEIPRLKFNEFDYEDADPKIFNLFMPVLYGVYDTTGISEDGAVECPNIDQVRFRRFVSVGVMSNVLRVFSKGNQDEPPLLRTEGTTPGTATTAQYQVLFPIVNGLQTTVVEFNLTGASQAEIDKFNELTITADVEGIEDIGDGTGILVRNADAVKHFMTNFVFNNYRSGNWLADDPERLDLDAFAEVQTFLNELGQDTSHRIGGTSAKVKAKNIVGDFATQLRVKIFWQENGTLGIRQNTPFILDVYINDPWIREGYHDIEEPDYSLDDSQTVQQVFVNYIYRPAGNEYLANIEVRDIELPGDKAETIDADWFRSANPEVV